MIEHHLASLLGDCKARGIRLSPSADGYALTINAPEGSLSDALRSRLKAAKPELLGYFLSASTASESASQPHSLARKNETQPQERSEPFMPTQQTCTRCRSSEYIDVSIHDGQSTRRDCARCNLTICFTRWYGKDV